MNKKLENILKIIQQSEKLDAEQKENLIKAVKDADKELEITAFKLERTEKVKKTTAILLEETIAELEQKRKDVEKHNRELEIEAGLERVRARGMAMQTSEELRALIGTLFTELTKFDLALTRCVIWIIDHKTKDAVWWMANSEDPYNPMSYLIPYHKKPTYLAFLKEWEKRTVKWVYDLKGQTKKSWDDHLFTKTELSKMPKFIRDGMRAPDRVLLSASFSNFGGMNVASLEPLSDEHFDILLRFAKVFDLTYTRFNDLKKAEAQAREAQIEAALERVRSRSIAMRKSDEIADIAAKIFSELRQLDLALNRVLIWTFNDAEKYTTWWSSNPEVESTAESYRIDYNENPVFINYLQAWQQRKPIHLFTLSGDTKKIWEDHLFEHTEMSRLPMEVRKGMRAEGTLYTVSVISDYGLMMSGSFEPLPEASIDIIQRFGRVFQQSYTRYLDVQKAEAQTRESEIQLALERVRARTMAMHKSEELADAAKIVFDQLTKLGVGHLASGVSIIDKNRPSGQMWISYQGDMHPKPFNIDFNSNPVLSRVYKSWKKGDPFFINQTSGQEFIQHIQFLKKVFGNRVEQYMETTKKQFQDSGKEMPDQMVMHHTFFSNGSLLLNNTEPIKEQEILNRFAKVFEQTYTRFLDLQKAEAQTREAQIEAALERVRSRSMGMHKSDELKYVVRLLYKEFRILVTDIDSVNIQLNLDSSKDINFWASVEEDIYPELYHMPYSDLPIFEKFYDAFNSPREEFFDSLFNKEEKDAFFNEIFKIQPVPLKRKKMIQNAEGMVMMGWLYKHSGIDIVHYNLKPFSEEVKDIVKRFAAAFEQTYIRFLDLQKAEAQARESEIQLALERVRARTMAMHNSEELSETVAVLFQQFNELGSAPERINICLMKEEVGMMEFWSTEQGGKQIDHSFNGSIYEPTTIAKVYKGWKGKEKSMVIDLTGKELDDWIRYLKEEIKLPFKDELRHERRVHTTAFFSNGALLISTPEPVSQETTNLLERFADVFNLTYRRFLDLQKAEAQAREAQIEAALEKVRARAMAMHSSDDLGETVDTFFSELTHLNVMPHRCGVGIINPETRIVDISATTATHENKIKTITGKLKLAGHPVLDKVFENWKLQKEYHPVLRGKEILEYYQVMNPQVEFPDFAGDETQYGYYFYFNEGGVFAWTEKELSEEYLNIFRRFTSVLSLTYRRYLDLREAEAQAREAVKQASLDRVRGEIASMRTSEDLNRITPVVWRELKTLEVPFIRCGVFIVDEANESVGVFLTTPDGKALGVLHLAFDSNNLTSNTVEHWRKKQVYKEHWNKEEFINWTKSMMKIGQVQNAETYQGSSQPPESLHLHFVPFAQGMLYVGNVDPLDEEKLELTKTLAEAFSIAYARYEDFKNLEEAKASVETTLKELKSAQAQLVHSEKMASLGELTAGIAHEIKNPLNFVNNFSEVSGELIDEMIEELEKGNNEDVLDIVKDLKQNLEKINHHGKRADSIVKGMLLHSRGTAGEKTPTDINDLLEQYVNLAYHGMRAQNKDFNITIERDYDKSLEKINVVPQDISRVFLNIINNACYAANDKKKKDGDGFSPTIKVSTKNLNDKVEIRIADNGNGIPKDIIDKIFQPFFTTKPTGEGTGLGLSLSYDIVTKVHGGELKVETKENEGTEFIIRIPAKTQ